MRTHWIEAAGLAAVLGCVGLGAPAWGQSTRPFTFHWAGHAGIPANGERWQDWAANIDFGETPMRRDLMVLYEGELGTFPAAGVHVVEDDPDFMRRHKLAIARCLDNRIPDVNFSGYAVIDYERWEVAWALLYNQPSNQGLNAHDTDFKDDWREYVVSRRPQTIEGLSGEALEAEFARQYDDAGKRFYLATLEECKRLRPQAKWGYYNFPPRNYHAVQDAERMAAWESTVKPTLQWLFEAQDALFPDVYAIYYTVQGRAPNYQRQEDAVADNERFLRENIRIARDCAGDKPVIAFIMFRYHDYNRFHQFRLLNTFNMWSSIVVPKDAGADGVAFWEAFNSTAEEREIQQYYTNTVAPIIHSVVQTPGATPEAPTPTEPTPETPDVAAPGNGRPGSPRQPLASTPGEPRGGLGSSSDMNTNSGRRQHSMITAAQQRAKEILDARKAQREARSTRGPRRGR